MESNVTNTSPAYDLAKLETLEGCFNELFRNKFMGLECCIPAIVISYDRPSHIATVQPAVNLVLANGKTTERPKISMSVMRMSSGGFLLDMPIAAGDTGWIVASDRDSTVVKQNSKKAPPLSLDMHKYEHGFFVPDKWGTVSVDNDDADSLILVSPDGKNKIRINNSGISIISTNAISLNGNVNVSGNITASGNAVISGSLTADKIFMTIDGVSKQIVKDKITYLNPSSTVTERDIIVPADSTPTYPLRVTVQVIGSLTGEYITMSPIEQYSYPGTTLTFTVISHKNSGRYYISEYWILVDSVRVKDVSGVKLYAGATVSYTIPTTATSTVEIKFTYSSSS